MKPTYIKEEGFHAILNEEKMFEDIQEIKKSLRERLEMKEKLDRAEKFLKDHPKKS